MELREYLLQSKQSISDFAILINVSRPYLSHIVNGKVPGLKMALIIEKKTKGKVGVSELRRNAKPKKERVKKKTSTDVFEQFELPLEGT